MYSPTPVLPVSARVKLCRDNQVELVLAVGGGSVIDCAKIIAAGVNYEGDPDFFIHNARITGALPIGTVLTLAATGSEMNANAVISNEDTGQKLISAADTSTLVFRSRSYSNLHRSHCKRPPVPRTS